MASVAVEGVSKVFAGGVAAVRSLDLRVHDRELLVLLGPSGCGKSTTLRLIAGLEELSAGEIRIGEAVVNRVSPRNRNVAMVFQSYALYPHLSVYRNMAFGLEMRYGNGWASRIWNRLTNPTTATELAEKRRGILAQVRQTAEVLGIEHLLDRMPRQLSGGERQRVALGRALVRQPAVFLFDEPLSNLDVKRRLEVRRELHELHRRMQVTTVYVTHDQTEAMALGERIAVMHQGTIQQIGTPQEIYEQPQNRFVASFVGLPPMCFLRGTLHRQGTEIRLRAAGVDLDVAIPQQRMPENQVVDVELGIRPEDITIKHCTSGCPDVQGVVSIVEPLGDCALVHTEIAATTKVERGKTLLVSRTDPRTGIREEIAWASCWTCAEPIGSMPRRVQTWP